MQRKARFSLHFIQEPFGESSLSNTKTSLQAVDFQPTDFAVKQSDTIYSLNGTRRHAMQKGVNIINGRKIITK